MKRSHLLLTALAALVLLFSLALVGGQARAADGSARVTDIRYWSNPSYTRVVIDLDRSPRDFTYRLLKKDPSINKPYRRLYVDITRAEMGDRLSRSVPINDGLLKRARSGQFNRSTVRVVLDIESIEEYKIFPLNEPYRIVIDVTGERGAAPKPASTGGRGEDEGEVSITRALGLKINTVVLDAGHGGRDPGAVGKKGLQEKNATLSLARKVRERLSGKVDRVIMTRDRDVFIPLEERTAIANKNDADMFVSIHINASPRRSATGIETYILNISQDDETRRLAARENSTSTRSVSDLEFILNDLIQTAKTNDSTILASAVQKDLVTRLKKKYRGVKSNGVKGAPFYVLVGTKMPAILVEASFISNPTEEKRLRSDAYLDTLADGIAEGVLRYMNGEAGSG